MIALAAVVVAALAYGAGSAFAADIVTNATPGYYNAGIGTVLDGTSGLFPLANGASGDPVINPAPAPNLAPAAGPLDGFLGPGVPTGASWSASPVPIPLTWAINTETAIVYDVLAPPAGYTNVQASIGVDNGFFLWVDGVYIRGALAPGGSFPGEYVFPLPNLSGGHHLIQILREDHGGATGFDVRISATPTPTADLSLAKSDTPDPVAAGSILAYALTVNNAGPDTASNVKITDTLPAGTTYVSGPGSCTSASGVVNCTVGSIPAGNGATVTLNVSPSGDGFITNGANVFSDTMDPNPANNHAEATTLVQGPTDVALTKLDAPDPVVAGDLLTYTLRLTNSGPGVGRVINLVDNLPAGVDFVSASPSCAPLNPFQIVCSPADIPAGGMVDLMIVVRTHTPGTLENLAVVDRRSYDPNGANNTATATTTVISPNRPPTVSAGGPYTVNEGSTVLLTASGSDPDGDVLSYAWDLDDNGSFETPGQSVSYLGVDGPAAPTVAVRATDPGGLSASAKTTVQVNNVAPTIGAITAPLAPVSVGTPVTTSAPFTDPGVLDTHTALWSWGDGTFSAGAISETNGSGTAEGTHTYTSAGVYTVTLTVTDKDGGFGQSIFQYVVVFDRAAGFVTGGGWIDSPAGAYVANPSLTGRATFGFVSKYVPGRTTPDGNTEFQFRAAGFTFKSTSYEWLVVSGWTSQYRGFGTVNGVAGYGFLLTAYDGDQPGGDSVDRFRIKIWNAATHAVVYDNRLGASDDIASADPQALGAGSVVIHRS